MNFAKKILASILAIIFQTGIGGFSAYGVAQTVLQKTKRIGQENSETLKDHINALKRENLSFVKAKKHLSNKQLKNEAALMGIGPDGSLLYFETLTGEIKDHKNGKLAGNLLKNIPKDDTDILGTNMEIGIWDQGLPRENHQEYIGRLLLGETSNLVNNTHATLVAGILLSSGMDPAAKGVAPLANAKAFDWLTDRLEATEQASEGLLISNHSYGIYAQSLPEWYFGAYLKISRDWDATQYLAPYYLSVVAAGNHANGHDRLIGFNTAKNSLSVGAVLSSEITTVAAYSAYGPTDDGRIKPDLVASGTNIYSSSAESNQSYSAQSGTSFSAPQVSGTALLLQEALYLKQEAYSRAATIKGILLHTALDVDIEGPDFKRGWGLLQKEEALNFVEELGNKTQIIEGILAHTKVNSYSFKAGATGLKVSLSWTDTAGNFINNGTLNPTDKQLVADLDLRILNEGQVYMPYILDSKTPNEPASFGDNNTDPYEQTLVLEPGDYTIEVSHKASLTKDQAFSLIVSGIALETAATTTEVTAPNTNAETATETVAVETFYNRDRLQGQENARIKPVAKQISLSSYPNPAVNKLHIKGLSSKSFGYKIFRADGSVAQSGKTSNAIINVYRLPVDFYILGMFTQEGYKALKFFKR